MAAAKRIRAHECVSEKRNKCSRRALYPSLDEGPRPRGFAEDVPLQAEEIEDFEKAQYAESTQLTRRSHIRKILELLDREFPGQRGNTPEREWLK